MKTGIIGSGDVARALSRGFLRDGDEVMLGTRDTSDGKLDDWKREGGERAHVGTFEETARFGDRVVLACKGAAVADAVAAAGPANLAGKLLIDATNPLDFDAGMPPGLIDIPEGSGAELVQARAPEAKVVKCWNTAPNSLMADPSALAGGPTMFICGDDAEAKGEVEALLQRWGWDVSDVGPLKMAHHLEGMCIVWVAHGARTGSWGHAFKILEA